MFLKLSCVLLAFLIHEACSEIRTVRVGVTLYPSYVEPCVLNEKNLFNVKCKDPGLSVKGEIDMSVDLWTSNTRRIQQASLSDPMIYKKRSFLISSNTVQVSDEEMNFIPLTFNILALIFCTILALSIMVGLLQLVGLKKWNKSVGTTVILFCWFMTTVILIGMYDAVVRTELMPRLSMPFKDAMGLAALLQSGQKRMIVEDPEAPFFSVIATADTPHYIALRQALKSNPVHVVGSQEVLAQLKAGEKYVYATNTVAAKFIMKGDCDLVEIPDELAEFSGLVLAFPLNSTLGEQFRETILQLHSTVSRIVNEAGSNRCLDSSVKVSPLPLGYLTMVFVTCAIGLGIALMVFLMELSWCKKQMEKNEFLSTVRDAVFMEGEHEVKENEIDYFRHNPTGGMYSNLREE